ncbi:MAG: tRNA pseudouridine(55) synthase TruB [Desulfobacteraceae bacterium]|nr:tRNA pseudouridine(55) synthase TruB [Desulfobacteraceae bacterium]
MNHGIVAVDKPVGISSAKVVARVKRHFNVKKVGHTGTLDPFATGLMLCGINKGTRISRFLLGGPKQYRATLCLGVTTDTLDCTGQVENRADPSLLARITRQQVEETVSSFVGRQLQHPPIYSALKHNGQPLYKLARQGKAVQKPPREIEIFSISMVNVEMPYVTIDVHSSAGTYIRSLAQDIGEKLGCGAHLTALRRTYSCGFSVDRAIPLSDLESMDREEALLRIVPMAEVLSFMPGFEADGDMLRKIGCGQNISLEKRIAPPTDPGAPFVKIIGPDGALAAVVEYDFEADKYNYCCVFID